MAFTLLSADTLARHSATLDRLHAPVATSRRIAFLQCGSASTLPLITEIAGVLQTVPGRRVATNLADSEHGAKQYADHNADVVLTDLGSFTSLSDAASAGVRHHALCIVAAPDRAEADPALALAEAIATEAGLNTIVALCAQPSGTNSSWALKHWARLTAARTSERVVFIPALIPALTPGRRTPKSRIPIAVATLAATLLNAASEVSA